MKKVKIDYLVEADPAARSLLSMFFKNKVVFTGVNDYQNGIITAGKTKEFPNRVSFTYFYIGQKLVCFYWGLSMIVNHKEIDILLDKYFEYDNKMEVDDFASIMLGGL